MSFLDNLENTLKAAESLEERTADQRRNQKEMDAQRQQSRALQPVAEELRTGKFTAELLNEVMRISHGMRTKVYISWIGSTLRLEAREHRMELVPTPEGVVARMSVAGTPSQSEAVDLSKAPQPLAQRWLAGVGPRSEPKTAVAE